MHSNVKKAIKAMMEKGLQVMMLWLEMYSNTTKIRKINWIGHISRRNFFLKHIEGEVEEGLSVTVRQGIRIKQLLDGLKDMKG